MRTREVVPGVADAIERRRTELGLSVEDLAGQVGVSTEALRRLRSGQRRDYAIKTKTGVARALGWPHDAIDRLFAGESPDDWDNLEPAHAPVTEDRLARLEVQMAEALAILRGLPGPGRDNR